MSEHTWVKGQTVDINLRNLLWHLLECDLNKKAKKSTLTRCFISAFLWCQSSENRCCSSICSDATAAVRRSDEKIWNLTPDSLDLARTSPNTQRE